MLADVRDDCRAVGLKLTGNRYELVSRLLRHTRKGGTLPAGNDNACWFGGTDGAP